MSNSYAHPVLRTTDLDEALDVVEQLLALGDTSQLEVDFDADITSPDALRLLLTLLPDADWWGRDPAVASNTTGASPYDNLPLHLRRWSVPTEFVTPFLSALGTESAAIRWDFNGWPAAPSVGLAPAGTRSAFLTLSVNSRDIHLDEPSPDHTVHVHVSGFQPERASWLAAQVGLQLLGAPAMSEL